MLYFCYSCFRITRCPFLSFGKYSFDRFLFHNILDICCSSGSCYNWPFSVDKRIRKQLDCLKIKNPYGGFGRGKSMRSERYFFCKTNLVNLFLFTNQTMQIDDNRIQQFICHCPVRCVLEVIKLLPRSLRKKKQQHH